MSQRLGRSVADGSQLPPNWKLAQTHWAVSPCPRRFPEVNNGLIQGYKVQAPLPFQFSSVQFSRSVMSDSLRPHEPQHGRPLCPSPTPRVYSNSYPLSRWCHPAISSSVVPFSSHLQSFPSSGSFQMSQLFASGGQSIGVSALASVLPMKT